MQHLEVSGAVRPLKWLLGVKWLILTTVIFIPKIQAEYEVSTGEETLLHNIMTCTDVNCYCKSDTGGTFSNDSFKFLYFPPHSTAQYLVKEKEQVQRDQKQNEHKSKRKRAISGQENRERRRRKPCCLISLVLKFAKNRRII